METTTETPRETIKLVSLGHGEWESQDGRVKIFHDHTFQTECDEPHAMKINLDTLRARYTDERAFNDYVATIKGGSYGGRVISKHTKSGWQQYLTWHCPGGEEHNYSMWTVQIDDDWTDDVYDTFEQARGVVEKLLNVETKLSRPRKPKPTSWVDQRPDAETETTENGARVWKSCGHRAEFDVDWHCYTCHEPVA